MEYEVPYTAVTLMELLGLKSKESFRKNYLNPAIELQLIQMTVPDKPRSRKDRCCWANMNVDAVAAQIKKRNYPAAIKEFCGEILLVGINYDILDVMSW